MLLDKVAVVFGDGSAWGHLYSMFFSGDATCFRTPRPSTRLRPQVQKYLGIYPCRRCQIIDWLRPVL